MAAFALLTKHRALGAGVGVLGVLSVLGGAGFGKAASGASIVLRANRKKLAPEPTLPASYVKCKNVELALEKSMINDQCGAHILVMPHATGKTTAALKVAAKLLEADRVAGVIYVDASVPTAQQTFSGKIEHALGIPVGSMFSAFNYAARIRSWLLASKPFVVIVDNINHVHLADSFRLDLLSVVGQSCATRNFVIVMICHEHGTALVMNEWNGRTKICLDRYLTQNLSSTSDEVTCAVAAQGLALSKPAADEFLRLSLLSKSVGFVAATAATIRAYEQVPKTQDETAKTLRDNFEAIAEIYKQSWDIQASAMASTSTLRNLSNLQTLAS